MMKRKLEDDTSSQAFSSSESTRSSAIELGDIVSPAWDGSPWDAELGIAYHGENGPVYYTGKGTKTTDEI